MENIHSDGALWLAFLLAAATLHGLWLALVLFLKNKRLRSARLLGITFVIFSLYLLNYLLFLTGTIRSLPYLLGVIHPLLFLVGPCYYFFIRHSLSPAYRFKPVQLLHLLPALFTMWRQLPLYLASNEYKLRVIDWAMNPGEDFTWVMLLLGNDFIYHIMVYVAAAWWVAHRVAAQQEAGPNHQDANWLKLFSLGFFLLLCLDLLLKFTFFAFRTPAFTVEYVMASVLALGIHLAGYRAIGRLGDFPKIRPATDEENSKYKTSPLTSSQIEAYQDALLSLMKEEKPYLDPYLKVSALAARLNIPSHYLSQVLNEGMSTNFYDFVNTYRVEAAKGRLKDEKYQHYSILAIGLECGFTNKTTFNRTFKKMAGMTPSEFVSRENVSS